LLNAEQEVWLQRRLDEGPTPEDGVCTLRGKDVQRIVEQEFGKVRSLDAIYYLLHKLGYESFQPRPRHQAANSEAQEAFKKVSPRESTRSSGSIRIVRFMSSSKTNAALANKER
jgi:transposase